MRTAAARVAAGVAALAALVVAFTAGAEEVPGRGVPDGSLRLGELEALADQLYDRSRFLMDQYGREVDLTIGEFERRFSEAEINFLLENYTAAIVFLYDVVDTPKFRELDRYDDALYYLAESLYRLDSLLPARGFFLDLIQRGPTRHDDDALIRLMEISGRVGDYTDIEEIYQRLVRSGRTIRPELRYVFGKFLFDRDDLPDSERWMRSREAFLQVPIDGPMGLAAKHFIGVTYVQEARTEWVSAQARHRTNIEALSQAESRFHRELERALTAFLEVVEQPASDRRAQHIQEQSWLAIGRVHLELGQAWESIDAYQRIHRHSDFYYQSLYEVAWAFVRRGDAENARRAAEILLTGAGDSTLAPEIRLLLGHLHARAKRYDRAITAYEEVVVEYAPVQREIDELIAAHPDPVAHFSDVIGRSGGAFDVGNLLPPTAARWASTQDEVERGLQIISDIEVGRSGIGEAREVAARILASLDGGTLDPWPELVEGHRYAKQTQSDALRAQSELQEMEHRILAHRVPGNLNEAYESARAEREQAEGVYRSLPATPDELLARREQWLSTVDRVHREAFRARIEAQSQLAQITAMRRLLRDQGDEITAEEGEVEAFLRRLERETEEVRNLEDQATTMMRQLDLLADAVRSDTAVAGAREVVDAYERALEDERALNARVRAAIGASDAELTRLDVVRSKLLPAGERTGRLIDDIERRGATRRRMLRDQVMTELRRLDEYSRDVVSVGEHTHDLVGRIAYSSVWSVRQKFYDLVLRSDVGIVDVAWAQKSDKSLEIQSLVEDKDRQLRILENDFRDVLRDAEQENRR